MSVLIRLVAAVILGAAGAAFAQVQLAGTEWSGSASVKAKVKPQGEKSQKQAGTTAYTLYFGPHAGEGLAADQFRAELDDGEAELEFDGSYAFSGGRLTLSPNSTAIANELKDLVEEVCPALYDPTTCSTIDAVTLNVTRAAFKQKVRTSKAGLTSIRSGAKIAIEAFLSGQRLLSMKLSFKSGSGGLQ